MSSDQQPMPGVKKDYDYRKLVFAGETFTLGDCVAIKVCLRLTKEMVIQRPPSFPF
jgi:hypothetical protein